MSGQHTNSDYAWRREGQRLVHHGGAVFIIERGDGFTDITAAPETLQAFQDRELARGVSVSDFAKRLMHLNREAAQWHERHPVK